MQSLFMSGEHDAPLTQAAPYDDTCEESFAYLGRRRSYKALIVNHRYTIVAVTLGALGAATVVYGVWRTYWPTIPQDHTPPKTKPSTEIESVDNFISSMGFSDVTTFQPPVSYCASDRLSNVKIPQHVISAAQTARPSRTITVPEEGEAGLRKALSKEIKSGWTKDALRIKCGSELWSVITLGDYMVMACLDKDISYGTSRTTFKHTWTPGNISVEASDDISTINTTLGRLKVIQDGPEGKILRERLALHSLYGTQERIPITGDINEYLLNAKPKKAATYIDKDTYAVHEYFPQMGVIYSLVNGQCFRFADSKHDIEGSIRKLLLHQSTVDKAVKAILYAGGLSESTQCEEPYVPEVYKEPIKVDKVATLVNNLSDHLARANQPPASFELDDTIWTIAVVQKAGVIQTHRKGTTRTAVVKSGRYVIDAIAILLEPNRSDKAVSFGDPIIPPAYPKTCVSMKHAVVNKVRDVLYSEKAVLHSTPLETVQEFTTAIQRTLIDYVPAIFSNELRLMKTPKYFYGMYKDKVFVLDRDTVPHNLRKTIFNLQDHTVTGHWGTLFRSLAAQTASLGVSSGRPLDPPTTASIRRDLDATVAGSGKKRTTFVYHGGEEVLKTKVGPCLDRAKIGRTQNMDGHGGLIEACRNGGYDGIEYGDKVYSSLVLTGSDDVDRFYLCKWDDDRYVSGSLIVLPGDASLMAFRTAISILESSREHIYLSAATMDPEFDVNRQFWDRMPHVLTGAAALGARLGETPWRLEMDPTDKNKVAYVYGEKIVFPQEEGDPATSAYTHTPKSTSRCPPYTPAEVAHRALAQFHSHEVPNELMTSIGHLAGALSGSEHNKDSYQATDLPEIQQYVISDVANQLWRKKRTIRKLGAEWNERQVALALSEPHEEYTVVECGGIQWLAIRGKKVSMVCARDLGKAWGVVTYPTDKVSLYQAVKTVYRESGVLGDVDSWDVIETTKACRTAYGLSNLFSNDKVGHFKADATKLTRDRGVWTKSSINNLSVQALAKYLTSNDRKKYTYRYKSEWFAHIVGSVRIIGCTRGGKRRCILMPSSSRVTPRVVNKIESAIDDDIKNDVFTELPFVDNALNPRQIHFAAKILNEEEEKSRAH